MITSASTTAGQVDVKSVAGTAQTANDNGADINLILADTGELQTNQGNWLTATGFATAANLATVDTNVDAILVDTGTTIPATIATVDANVDTILLDTDELQTTLSAGILARTNNKTLESLIHHIVNMVESQRMHHSHISIGHTFYVDPVNGATHASGARGGISDPYLTIQDCHDNAVTDSNHDCILVMPGSTSGVTTHTVAATTTISKNYVFIRGPGRDVILTRTGSGDTLSITGDGVEIEGFQIGTAATGSGIGVSIAGDFAFINNCWINNTRGDGINIDQADNCIIQNNRFQNTGAGGSGDGLEINGTGTTSSFNVVRNNIFEDVTGDAIRITGGTITDTIIDGNTIHGASGWGIEVGSASAGAVISNNIMGNNTSGNITDSGSTTLDINNTQWAKDSIATEARLAELDSANLPSDVDLILADTNELQTDWVDGGRLDLLLDGASSAGDPWGTTLPAAYGAGTAGEILGDWINGGRLDLILDTAAGGGAGLTSQQVRDSLKLAPTAGAPAAGSIDEHLDNIEADTNELQTDDTPAAIAALDAVVDTVKAETALILVDTAEIGTAGAGLTNIGTIATVTTVTNEVTADVTKISGSATAANNLEASTLGIHATTVATGASATEFTLTAGSTVDDHYIGRIVVFTDGTLANQATDITDYVGSTKTVTVTALTSTPSGNTLVIV